MSINQVQAPSSRGNNVFFSTGSKTNADKLKNSLAALGLEQYAPKQNSKLVATHQALKSVCGRKDRLIRPLKGEPGYAVVREEKGEDGKSLSHTVEFDALMPAGSDFPVFRNPDGEYFSPVEDGAITHRFQIECERVQASAVSKSLVQIIDYMHGISLRPRGGVYWIPQGAVAKFEKVAECFQNSCEGNLNKVYFQTTVHDDKLRDSVIMGLTESIENETRQMLEALSQPDVGKRAKKTKMDRCGKLLKRISGYEKMFQVSLQELQKHVADVEAEAMMTAFGNN